MPSVGRTEWDKRLEDVRKKQNNRVEDVGRITLNGHIIRNFNWSDIGFIRECYEEFLRMAQLGQKSKLSGKAILEMTFPEYLREAKKNLQWRIQTDLPMKHMIHEEGGVGGLSGDELILAKEVCTKSTGAIDWYLSLPPETRLTLV